MAPQDFEDLPFESPPAKRLRTRESEEGDMPASMPQSMDDTDEIGSNAATLLQLSKPHIENTNPLPVLHNEISDASYIPGLGAWGEMRHGAIAKNSLDHKSNLVPPVAQNDVQFNNELQSQETVTNPISQILTSDLGNPALLSQDDSPSVTSALEAMLGGITPPADEMVAAVANIQGIEETEQHQVADPATEVDPVTISVNNEPSLSSARTANESPVNIHETTSTNGTSDAEIVDMDGGNNEAEFEIDSSPVESSSDDSDSDNSSSQESEDDDAYELLGPEEQARILMEGDGGSDDEGGGKGSKGPGGQLRTKNEVPEEVVPKPNVVITADMKIEELGLVEAVVENILLIKAKTSGEYRVLESGSVLCMENRDVIGVVSETLGRVQQPLYSVRFTNATEISEAGLVVGTNIYYSVQHSSYVFTQALKVYKGSDASNLHDEEVCDEEIEFSDDEAEMEHKRRIKQKKLDKRGGKMQQNAPSRSGHPLQQEHAPYNPSVGLNYDDGEDDGPYKTLTRPPGYAEMSSRSEAPQEGSGFPSRVHRKEDSAVQHQSRDSYGGRGRGERGRGRGDRGRGRGGFDRRGNSDYRLPAESYRNASFPNPSEDPRRNNFTTPQPYPTSQNFGQNNSPNFHHAATSTYLPQGPQFPSPFPQNFQQPVPQQFQSPYPAPSWPQPPLSTGAFINPAFFGQQQAAAQQWNPAAATWNPPQQQPQQQQQDAARAFADAQQALHNVLKNLSGSR